VVALSIKLIPVYIDRTIRVKNLTGQVLTALEIVDDLPAGFAYKRGTARLDNKLLADPSGGGGSHQVFQLGKEDTNVTLTLTYTVEIGSGSIQGSGINYAYAEASLGGGMAESSATSAKAIKSNATSAKAIKSNVASAKVKINQSVFTDKSVIIGKLFVDLNQNRVQDDGEVGVPGVRIYLEDGTYIVTDSEGKYSIYGIKSGTHVLKVDPITLPRGAKLEILNTRNAGYAGTLFVDLKSYELHKANFAIAPGSPEMMKEIEARRGKGEVEVAEIERGLTQRLTPDGSVVTPSDTKALPASGLAGGLSTNSSSTNLPQAPSLAAPKTNNVVVDTNAPTSAAELAATNKASMFTSVLPENTLDSGNSALPGSPVAAIPRVNLESQLTNMPSLDNKLGFLDLREGDVMPADQAIVRVKGPAGAGAPRSGGDRRVSEARR